MDVVEAFSDFVYLFTEADSPEGTIEEVPDGGGGSRGWDARRSGGYRHWPDAGEPGMA
jgi:hypothetical protein